jgi:aminoglycoside phosphotransferase (APT) family kinase protein
MGKRRMETGWERRDAPPRPEAAALEGAVRDYAGERPFTVGDALRGGLVNLNLDVRLEDPPERAVLRVFSRDPMAARKEAALALRLGGALPMPRVLDVGELEGSGAAWTLQQRIGGTALADVLDEAPEATVARAGRELGRAAALLHTHATGAMGLLDRSLAVSEPLGGIVRVFEDHVLPLLAGGRSGEALGADLAGRLARFIRDRLAWIAVLEGTTSLVHGDFKPTNVFIHPGGELGGILDWEFCWSAAPLIDLGQMLRWPTPPGFADALAAGYRDAGGVLPADWEAKARFLDLMNLVTLLDEPTPRPVVARDVSRFVEATMARR